jgi:hypothetical protein
MAFSKEILTSFGVVAGYWRIASGIESYPDSRNIVMGGYVNKAARDAGAQPIARKDYVFIPAVDSENVPELVYDPDDDRAALYTKLKMLPEWADAVDC